MEQKTYHATLKAMQEAGVDRDYTTGWASGVLGNPELEEQRVNEAYTAGYADGESGNTDGYKSWVR